MFRLFASVPDKSVPEKNHLENSKELASLVAHLAKLRAKTNEIKAAVQDDAANVGYMKSRLLDTLMVRIDGCVDNFNKTPPSAVKREEVTSMILLVNALQTVIEDTLINHGDVLNTKRSGTKEAAQLGVWLATKASAVALGVMSGSFLIGAGAWLFSSDAAMEATGLDSNNTASTMILNDFLQSLKLINKSLHFVCDELEETSDESSTARVVLRCPITMERIKEPVLCLLDNRMYEKKAITRCLEETRTSPMNRERMTEGQTPSDVLIENISLRQALEELRQLQMSNSEENNSSVVASCSA